MMVARIDPELNPEDVAIFTEIIDADEPGDPSLESWTPDDGNTEVFDENDDPITPSYTGSLTSTEQTELAETFTPAPGTGPYALEMNPSDNLGCTTFVANPYVQNNKAKSGTEFGCTDLVVEAVTAANWLSRIRDDGFKKLRDHRASGGHRYAEIRTNETCEHTYLREWSAKGRGSLYTTPLHNHYYRPYVRTGRHSRYCYG